jgi:hypothetical protein
MKTVAFRGAFFLSCLLAAASVAAAEDGSLDDSLRIGGNIEVTEPTEGGLHALGGRITVDAPVGGSLRAAGGKIEVGSSAVIGGSASLAGGSIVVKGSIGGDLHAAGGQITIDGPIAGDASVAGGTLTLGPDARISGKLKFHGGELVRDANAQVLGATIHSHRRARSHEHVEHASGNDFGRGWFWSAGLVLMAALLAGALPGPSRRLAQELRERPWVTPLLGFLALTAIPIAALLVMITIIGIPIGLLALALYAVLLLVGYVWLAVVLGGLLLDRFKAETAQETAWRVGAAMLAMIALAILVRVPLVGGLVKFAALIVGVGMIVGVVMRRVNPVETGVARSS